MDKTLLKGLRVLETLAASPQPMGVTAVSRALDLTKSNAHRTLQTLTTAGYVRTHPESGTYECTLKLFEISSSVIARLDVRQLADPYMQRLAGETRESIHLSVLAGMEVIYVNKIESPQPVRAYSAIGGRAPAHCVASGKALLAWQAEHVLADLPEDLARWTPHSLTGRDALLEDLAETRRRGFSINRGEWRDAVGGVASPVFDAHGVPVASLGISGPLERLSLSTLRGHAPVVIDTARALSRALGYRGKAYPDTAAA